MQHVFALVVTQPPPPHHCSLHADDRPENTAADGGGVTVRSSDSFQGVCIATGYGDLLQVTWVTTHRDGR